MKAAVAKLPARRWKRWREPNVDVKWNGMTEKQGNDATSFIMNCEMAPVTQERRNDGFEFVVLKTSLIEEYVKLKLQQDRKKRGS